ncbi:MAG: acetoin utilization protein AcuC [Candidatus Promineifilaceae bacterium]
MREVAFLSSSDVWRFGHGPDHPLKPTRLKRTHELLEELGAFDAANVQLIAPRQATLSELALFHSREYIEIVRTTKDSSGSTDLSRFGFGPGDNPVFEGMFESESRKVGSALQAAEMLVGGQCDVAFSYSGGLHHGGPDYASGFCVFNDAAVAIKWLVEQGYRVAYVDIDVHHGDGVQNAFYHDDRVLTLSIHQDGRTLFPGTGAVEEIGIGTGEGTSVNVPLPPYVDDEMYLAAFRAIVPQVIGRFEADVMVTQLGLDTHALDPLAHLRLTTRGQEELVRSLGDNAPLWLALGGGGYNLDVVPRAWALALGVMAGLDFPERLPANYRRNYGGRWLRDQQNFYLDNEARSAIQVQVSAIVRQVKDAHGLD